MTENILEIALTLLTIILGAGVFKTSTEKKKSRLENEKLRLEVEKLSKEKEEVIMKLNFLDKVLDLPFINQISSAIEYIFEKTKADRFLILIAKNGKEDFNIVNVVFEQHKNKEYRINAITRYRNVTIDNPYRMMLKEAEFRGVIELETAKMKDSLLKTFYEIEGVKHSKIRHLARKPIDENNDFLVFSSLGTHSNTKFTTREIAIIKTQYEGIIMPALKKVMD